MGEEGSALQVHPHLIQLHEFLCNLIIGDEIFTFLLTTGVDHKFISLLGHNLVWPRLLYLFILCLSCTVKEQG